MKTREGKKTRGREAEETEEKNREIERKREEIAGRETEETGKRTGGMKRKS